MKEDCEITISRIVTTLKQDVSYRFLNLSREKVDGLYTYTKGDDKIIILESNLLELNRNHLIVFDTINFRWTNILEGFNHSPRIFKKVEVIDLEEVKRKPLGKFRDYIECKNLENTCFICGEKILGDPPL